MPMAMSHTGHGVRKTNLPLWKMLSGYLKRISNMKSAIREYAVDSVDVAGVSGSYRQFHIAGKFNMRAHFREALVSGQDSTGVSGTGYITSKYTEAWPAEFRGYVACPRNSL
jgi:hypothetical protein